MQEIPVRATLQALLADEDTDGDRKITVDDARIDGTGRGDKQFWIDAPGGRRYEVAGTYYLSNLLQELKLAQEAGLESVRLDPEKIFEDPAHRLSRSIRERFWDGLTRRIDARGLPAILADDKTETVDGLHYLYVPHDDPAALEYFTGIADRTPELKMKVVRLPEKITPAYVRSLKGRQGLLSLGLRRNKQGIYEGLPFVVPGGRFNEMYGWDSYFIVLGLLEDGRVSLAQSMVDNFVYEIHHYGKVLNANRTYYLTRSQPPFLTSMALAVYRRLPKDPDAKAWLARTLTAAIREYRQVWTGPDRLTSTGLSRYFDSGTGPPPEVESGHFDPIFSAFARKAGMSEDAFEAGYRSGKIASPELDAWFVHDRCMRESGHDTSYRLLGRCAELVTVDLNSLLYKIETDLAQTIESEFSGALETGGGRETAAEWRQRAEKRKQLMNRYLWNPERGMFFDYDFVREKQTGYESATTLYPLWAGLASGIQAKALVQRALPLFETPGGIVSSTLPSRGPITPEHPLRQWDYPYGWAPHQMLVWRGLLRYGYDSEARDLAYRWLYTIALNAADYNGTIPEKFDVAARSHEVFAEYGNVGTKFSYITREGFGWTNASFQVGLRLLTEAQRRQLNRLVPPEWLLSR